MMFCFAGNGRLTAAEPCASGESKCSCTAKSVLTRAYYFFIGLSACLHCRSSQAGEAYRVPDPRSNVQRSNGSFSTYFHPFANNGPGHALQQQQQQQKHGTSAAAAAAATGKAPVIPSASPAQLGVQQQASAAADAAAAWGGSAGQGRVGKGKRGQRRL
jgi:hypothetical protein